MPHNGRPLIVATLAYFYEVQVLLKRVNLWWVIELSKFLFIIIKGSEVSTNHWFFSKV